MKCRNCDTEMNLIDFESSFRGNSTNTRKCNNCGTISVERIIYNRPVKITWILDGKIQEIVRHQVGGNICQKISFTD